MSTHVGIDRRIRPEGIITGREHYRNTLQQLQALYADNLGFGGGSAILPCVVFQDTLSAGTFQINTTGKRCAWLFVAPKTGGISHAFVAFNAITSSQTMRVGIQTVSSGNPTGTSLGSGTFSPATGWVAFSAEASVTQGTVYAVVLRFDSTAGDVTVYSNANRGFYGRMGMPVCKTYDGSSWSFSSAFQEGCICGIQYDSEKVHVPGFMPTTGWDQQSYSSSSNPDRRGVVLKIPYRARLSCINALVESNAGWQLVFYDKDGSTALYTSPTLDANNKIDSNCKNYSFPINPAIYIEPGERYYCSVRPTTTTAIKQTVWVGDVAATYPIAFGALLSSDFEYHSATANGTPSGTGSWTLTNNLWRGITFGLEEIGY